MKKYKLKENEAVLFKGSAMLSSDYKRADSDSKSCDIMLTNLNIILSYQKKGLFKTVKRASVFKVADVKIYDDNVQIISERGKTEVDVYLKKTELYLTFDDEKIAKDFCNKAITIITGDPQWARIAKRAGKVLSKTVEEFGETVSEISPSVKSAVGTVALGVETVKTVSKAINNVKK